MSKSVLVIDTPSCCGMCEMSGTGVCRQWMKVDRKKINEKRDDHCPLKPLPQKLDANDWHRMFSGEYAIREAKGYGYNACLEEITGETK